MKFSTITYGLPYRMIFWIGLGTLVIALLFVFPTPPPHKYVETVNAEVISVRVLSPQPPQSSIVELRFDDGSHAFIRVSTSVVILRGQVILVDKFEMEGKNPRYRLAQNPATP